MSKLLPAFLVLLAAARPALATNAMDMDLRFTAESIQSDVLDQTFIYRTDILPSLSANLGVRIGESTSDLDSFSYEGELAWTPLSFVSLRARLNHENLLSDTTEVDNLMGYVRLSARPWNWLEIFGSCGWYERFILLSKTLVVPTFRNDLREHDFVADFGVNYEFLQDWWFKFRTATFEEIDIFNLNNPFLQAGLEFRPVPLTAIDLYARYKILLGFGRIDSFLVGLGLRIDFPAVGMD